MCCIFVSYVAYIMPFCFQTFSKMLTEDCCTQQMGFIPETRIANQLQHRKCRGSFFVFFSPFPPADVKSHISSEMPSASVTEVCVAVITCNGWNHLTEPTGEEVCKFIWSKNPKSYTSFCFKFALFFSAPQRPPLFFSAYFPPQNLLV